MRQAGQQVGQRAGRGGVPGVGRPEELQANAALQLVREIGVTHNNVLACGGVAHAGGGSGRVGGCSAACEAQRGARARAAGARAPSSSVGPNSTELPATWRTRRAQQAQRGAVQVARDRVPRKDEALALERRLRVCAGDAARAAPPRGLAKAPVPLGRVAARRKLRPRAVHAPAGGRRQRRRCVTGLRRGRRGSYNRRAARCACVPQKRRAPPPT